MSTMRWKARVVDQRLVRAAAGTNHRGKCIHCNIIIASVHDDARKNCARYLVKFRTISMNEECAEKVWDIIEESTIQPPSQVESSPSLLPGYLLH